MMEPGSGQAAQRPRWHSGRGTWGGHHDPQLAGEDTEAVRTRVQRKVTRLAGGWEAPHAGA